jgi:glycerol uptake facilitator-like aquaporin
MKKLFQNTLFIIGFWGVLIIFFLLNILPSTTDTLSNITSDFGFPLVAYRTNLSSNYSTYVFWYGLIADIVIALIGSFAMGLFLKFTWLKISSRRLS